MTVRFSGRTVDLSTTYNIGFFKGKISLEHQIISLVINFWIIFVYNIGIFCTKNWGEGLSAQVL